MNYYLKLATFRHGRAARRRRPLKCAGAADTVEPQSRNSGKIPRDCKPQAGSRSACAGSTKSVPLRPGARPSGRACTGAAPTIARDGFIHFSTASQVAETARKHFSGQTGLFLIEVDADALGDALRWEPSRNDELFPHLYGELDLGAVTGVRELRARSDGSHDIPELEP